MNRDLFSMRIACLEVFSISPGVAVHVILGVDSHCSVQTSTVVYTYILHLSKTLIRISPVADDRLAQAFCPP